MGEQEDPALKVLQLECIIEAKDREIANLRALLSGQAPPAAPQAVDQEEMTKLRNEVTRLRAQVAALESLPKESSAAQQSAASQPSTESGATAEILKQCHYMCNALREQLEQAQGRLGQRQPHSAKGEVPQQQQQQECQHQQLHQQQPMQATMDVAAAATAAALPTPPTTATPAAQTPASLHATQTAAPPAPSPLNIWFLNPLDVRKVQWEQQPQGSPLPAGAHFPATSQGGSATSQGGHGTPQGGHATSQGGHATSQWGHGTPQGGHAAPHGDPAQPSVPPAGSMNMYAWMQRLQQQQQ